MTEPLTDQPLPHPRNFLHQYAEERRAAEGKEGDRKDLYRRRPDAQDPVGPQAERTPDPTGNDAQE